ncbi:MAG: hypothetical protein JOZ52_00710, partial [Acidobacteria bacterium]|nr:hypothetical protein [Acidobacteriota bacterium]
MKIKESAARYLYRLCAPALCLCLMLAGVISSAEAAQPRFVVDLTFGAGGFSKTAFDFDDTVQEILRQPDGKLIAVGTTTQQFQTGFQYHTSLARYNVDGSLDMTFGINGKVIVPSGSSGAAGALQPDGKIL